MSPEQRDAVLAAMSAASEDRNGVGFLWCPSQMQIATCAGHFSSCVATVCLVCVMQAQQAQQSQFYEAGE